MDKFCVFIFAFIDENRGGGISDPKLAYAPEKNGLGLGYFVYTVGRGYDETLVYMLSLNHPLCKYRYTWACDPMLIQL